ncbi:MAG: hypothetical protein U1E25_06770 [Methylocystis sp.]
MRIDRVVSKAPMETDWLRVSAVTARIISGVEHRDAGRVHTIGLRRERCGGGPKVAGAVLLASFAHRAQEAIAPRLLANKALFVDVITELVEKLRRRPLVWMPLVLRPEVVKEEPAVMLTREQGPTTISRLVWLPSESQSYSHQTSSLIASTNA